MIPSGATIVSDSAGIAVGKWLPVRAVYKNEPDERGKEPLRVSFAAVAGCFGGKAVHDQILESLGFFCYH